MKKITRSFESYKEASGDAWGFFKKFFETSTDDAYWKAVIECANEIGEKYEGTPLEDYVVEYLVVLMNELSRKHKEKNR